MLQLHPQMENGAAPSPPAMDETLGRVRSTSSSSVHRRNLSGSLLAKLSFLRMNQTSHSPPKPSEEDGDDADDDFVRDSRTIMSSALQQQRRTRRRRGSLRKTALLGTRFEGRERKLSRTGSGASSRPQRVSSLRAQVVSAQGEAGRRLTEEDEEGSLEWNITAQEQRGETRPSHSNDLHARRDDMLPDREGEGGGATTDEDEDIMTFRRARLNKENNHLHPNSAAGNAAIHTSSSSTGLQIPTPSSSTSESYYLQHQGQPYRPAVHRTSSPLAAHAPEIKSPGTSSINWDYSETEWWGWTILVVTWLVFVVGMGSCFEVWSWAWDVGETPYAPPELEDDATLPIVGYYPALIILTAVMAWVWVVVAWVGMKYFKHANISGDDI